MMKLANDLLPKRLKNKTMGFIARNWEGQTWGHHLE